MKACPICQSTYEDWIEFCFNDGVPLVAYEPKPTPTRASVPRPAAPSHGSSSYDAPEARLVSGAELPEPANLSRFSAPAVAAVAPRVEPEPQRVAPVAPLVAPPVAGAAPLLAPVVTPPPVWEEPAAPVAAAPVVAIPPAPVVPAPPAPVVAPPLSAQREDHSPPSATPTDFDADAMSDIASALNAPAALGSGGGSGGGAGSGSGGGSALGAAPVTFHPPLRAESEDAKATVPMYTAHPEEAPVGRSVLDDEPGRKAVAGAGIGVAVLGLLALGAFVVVAAIGIWWTMSSGGQPSSTAGREPAPVTASKVLPAAAEPAPVVPVVPVEAAPVEPVVPVVTPVVAPVVATTTPASTGTTTPAGKTPTATTSRTGTSGATASLPRDTTPSSTTGTRGSTTPATTDAGTSSVTSDSVWGTPTAPTSGFLRIVTDPDGATVYVNDAAKGKTPVTIELPYGAHQVRVVRAGYKTEVRDVNIRVRELTVPFNLKPEVVTGQVNVYGPDGFRVVVDGHDMGLMPVTVQVSEGVRQFKLVGTDSSTCNLPKEIKFKTVGRPETITLACP